MRKYETIFILKPDLNDDAKKSLGTKVQAFVTKKKGKVHHFEDLGKQRLAYEIKKEIKGHFFYLGFESDGTCLPLLERELRLLEEVLKFQSCLVPGDFQPAIVTMERKTSGSQRSGRGSSYGEDAMGDGPPRGRPYENKMAVDSGSKAGPGDSGDGKDTPPAQPTPLPNQAG